MTKSTRKQPTPAMKKQVAHMMKQIFKTPKQKAKDAAEAVRRRIRYLHEKEKEERIKYIQNIQNITPSG